VASNTTYRYQTDAYTPAGTWKQADTTDSFTTDVSATLMAGASSDDQRRAGTESAFTREASE
jgi:hypothetical protein